MFHLVVSIPSPHFFCLVSQNQAEARVGVRKRRGHVREIHPIFFRIPFFSSSSGRRYSGILQLHVSSSVGSVCISFLSHAQQQSPLREDVHGTQ